MKTSLLCLFAAGCLALSGCHKHGEEGHEHEIHPEEAAAEEHGHKHGDNEIQVHDNIAERFGLKTGTVEKGDFATSVRASGTVAASSTADGVVSAPTAGIVRFARGINPGSEVSRGSVIASIDATGMAGGDTNAAARAALEAAKTEYDRIESLYKDRLATVAERNAALAAYNAAKAGYSDRAASGRATSPISGTVTTLAVREGQFVEAGEIIANVASSADLIMRIELPQRYYRLAPEINDAVAVFSYLPEALSVSAAAGRRTGSAPIPENSSAAYIPIYFSVPRASGIVPGSTFSAYLLGNNRKDVTTVPNSALSEQQGQYFVYEQVHPEVYMKVPVTIGESDGRRTEILSGIEPGKTIVTEGVTTVRLAETGGNIPEGHSHSH